MQRNTVNALRSGGVTPFNKLYSYVPPQRVRFFFRHFGLKTGRGFALFAQESGMSFKGTTRVCDCMFQYFTCMLQGNCRSLHGRVIGVVTHTMVKGISHGKKSRGKFTVVTWLHMNHQGKLAALTASCLHLRHCTPILVIIAVDHGRISCCVENFCII